jgi:peptidoglycan/xylan/chitin deacetylase (PgdA/CDA1 family)
MLERHIRRIKAQGIPSAILYYTNTGIAERSGVHVLRVFRHAECVPPASVGADFALLSCPTDLIPADKRALTDYGGAPLLVDFDEAWARGERAIFARVDGELACVCWLTRETDFLPSAGAPCTLVQRCFTLPAFRGRGIYPETLKFATGLLAEEEPRLPALIESEVFNSGSIHGIEKAGFVAYGIRVRMGKKDWFVQAIAPGQRAWRQIAKSVMLHALPNRLLVVRFAAADNAVYLTFDDGPHPENTPKLLDLLLEQDVRATFFVVGACVEKYPWIVERMVRDGHTVGHHSFHHRPPATISARELMNEIRKTRRVLEPIVGRSHLFRPPEGAVTATKLFRLWMSRQTVVLWNADPKDCNRDAKELAGWFATHPLSAGDVVLLHDDMPAALSVLPSAIAAARARGLRFRALDEATSG